eukprot:5861306-Pleurochrysis_carterae.AAC.1
MFALRYDAQLTSTRNAVPFLCLLWVWRAARERAARVSRRQASHAARAPVPAVARQSFAA